MTILKAHFSDGTAFLERYLADLGQGGLFYPTRRPLAIGEIVVVAIRLGRRRSPTLIRGQVAWRRPGKHSTKTKAGIGIEFLPTETQARDYLLAVARGDSAEMVARRHQRLPVEIPVLWAVPGELRDNAGVLRDIGRGGAFIKTEQPLPVGTELALKFSVVLDQIETIEGTGVVVRVEDSPRGVGVVFKELDAYSRELVERLLVAKH